MRSRLGRCSIRHDRDPPRGSEPIPRPRGCSEDRTTVIDMNRGFPSLTALLGLLAIAGYQNRDKIAELLRGAQAKPAGSPGASQGGQDGTLGNLGGLLGGTSVGGLLGSGLRELIDSFKSIGQGGRTSRSRRRSSSARSAPRSGRPCPSEPGCHDRSFCRGCRGSCLTPSTSTRRRASFPHPRA